MSQRDPFTEAFLREHGIIPSPRLDDWQALAEQAAIDPSTVRTLIEPEQFYIDKPMQDMGVTAVAVGISDVTGMTRSGAYTAGANEKMLVRFETRDGATHGFEIGKTELVRLTGDVEFRDYVREAIRVILGLALPAERDPDIALNGRIKLHARERLLAQPDLTRAQRAAIAAGEPRWRDAIDVPERVTPARIPAASPRVPVTISAPQADPAPTHEPVLSSATINTKEAPEWQPRPSLLRRLWRRLRRR